MDYMDKKITRYHALIEEKAEKPSILRNTFVAFLSGGFICLLAQILYSFLQGRGNSEAIATTLTTISLIVTASVLTGTGHYEKIGRFCGAGSVVPVTGFANSITAPAIEYKKEGYVFGLASKLFLVSGPVIVYGLISSMLVGLVYYIFGR